LSDPPLPLPLPVDPHDVELLRAETPADPSTRERVRKRLAAAIPIGAPGVGGPSAPDAPRGRPTASPGAALVAGRVVPTVTFVLGGLAGAALYAAVVKQPPPGVVYVDRPTAAVAPPPPPSPTEAASEASPGPPVPSTRSAAHPPSTKTPESQLLAERIILDQARAGLLQGDAARALRLTDRHRRAFSNPLLGEERDALEVQSLVKAGRYDEARARAAAFHKQAPGSLFSSVVDSAIESIP
jgi:hypothetical protein